MSRLRSDIFVSALIRRANGQGAFAALTHKGSEEAGAIFVKVARMDRTADLYGPAPQSVFDEASPDRQFEQLMAAAPEFEVDDRIRSERRFDSDCWVVEIEDREGRDWDLLARHPHG
jgi:hypothetical protein